MADKPIRVYDLPEGSRLSRRLKLAANVGSFAWSQDGRFLAAPLEDGTIWVWETSSWEGHKITTSRAPFHVVSWSPGSPPPLAGGRPGATPFFRGSAPNPP